MPNNTSLTRMKGQCEGQCLLYYRVNAIMPRALQHCVYISYMIPDFQPTNV